MKVNGKYFFRYSTINKNIITMKIFTFYIIYILTIVTDVNF